MRMPLHPFVRRGGVAGTIAVAVASFACGGNITGPPKPAARPSGPLAFVVPASAPADGATWVMLSATVDTSVARDQRKVIFTTSAGSFGGESSTTVPADTLRVARAVLTPPRDSTVAIVTATVGTVTRTDSIVFRSALPESIQLTADAFALDAGLGNAVTVRALLRRSVGVPSAGRAVNFVRRAPSDSVGALSVSVGFTDSQGIATVRFTAGATKYRGPVLIVAMAHGAGGELSDSTTIVVR